MKALRVNSLSHYWDKIDTHLKKNSSEENPPIALRGSLSYANGTANGKQDQTVV
jgi:hypothetical protein